ncbi:hypothetical protein [Tissierella sp. Yu-01]|uniref:hypothetical protein n=1 Tax=Tissierella sp. Yu-01 TaxID=3035694 RepID=UPI00240DD01B|nr:hypothetical protein [Tissierella sp. Yu-01]WFA09965.1 hypothetical protein P3962_05280 [Tissierella sp. Yu-01]
MNINKNKFYILICSIIGTTFTWFINHQMGYGAIVASGLVGVIAAILLPDYLAGATYTASFVGMGAITIIPSFMVALFAGIVVGLLIVSTTEIYAGIGGKGGTTATLATILTKTILVIFR